MAGSTRPTIAWVVGNSDAERVPRLDKKLMHWNDCMFDTDDWDALAMIRPNERYSIGKKQAVAIEPDNSNTRHHPGRMTGRRKIVSRSEKMISLSIRLWQSLTTVEVFLSLSGEILILSINGHSQPLNKPANDLR